MGIGFEICKRHLQPGYSPWLPLPPPPITTTCIEGTYDPMYRSADRISPDAYVSAIQAEARNGLWRRSESDGRISYEEFQTTMKAGTEWRNYYSYNKTIKARIYIKWICKGKSLPDLTPTAFCCILIDRETIWDALDLSAAHSRMELPLQMEKEPVYVNAKRPVAPEPASRSLLEKRMLASLGHDQTNAVKHQSGLADYRAVQVSGMQLTRITKPNRHVIRPGNQIRRDGPTTKDRELVCLLFVVKVVTKELEAKSVSLLDFQNQWEYKCTFEKYCKSFDSVLFIEYCLSMLLFITLLFTNVTVHQKVKIIPMASRDQQWYMDTEATSHLSSHTGNLQTSSLNCNFHSIIVGNGSSIHVTHSGHVQIPNPYHHLHLRNVLVTPNIIKTLVSVRKFTTGNNFSIDFDPYGFTVRDYHTRQTRLRCDSTGDLYPLHVAASAFAPLTNNHSLWHQRLGHRGDAVIHTLSSRGLVSYNKQNTQHL
nr:hypothetical protein [Tanacetum cinerariifolium]